MVAAGPSSRNDWPHTLHQLAPPPTPAGPSSNPSPAGRGVKCEVTPTGLLTRFLGSFFSHRGYLFLSWRVFVSLTERTEFTEFFGAHFEPTEGLRHTDITEASPPAPLRMERGVVCEVTPISLLLIEDGPLNILRTYRGISVITPLSIRRGAGGEASVAVRFCEIG